MTKLYDNSNSDWINLSYPITDIINPTPSISNPCEVLPSVYAVSTFVTELDLLKAKLDFSNVAENLDFIVEHGEWQKPSGVTTGVLDWWWYDKYRSGKVVQGGKTALQTQDGYYTINLPVEMDSANYIITMAYDGVDGALITGGTYDATTASNISATKFDTYLRITHNMKYKFWRVEGKAATE